MFGISFLRKPAPDIGALRDRLIVAESKNLLLEDRTIAAETHEAALINALEKVLRSKREPRKDKQSIRAAKDAKTAQLEAELGPRLSLHRAETGRAG